MIIYTAKIQWMIQWMIRFPTLLQQWMILSPSLLKDCKFASKMSIYITPWQKYLMRWIYKKRFKMALETVNGQWWITQNVCEEVSGHETSCSEGMVARHRPTVAWNNHQMMSTWLMAVNESAVLQTMITGRNSCGRRLLSWCWRRRTQNFLRFILQLIQLVVNAGNRLLQPASTTRMLCKNVKCQSRS